MSTAEKPPPIGHWPIAFALGGTPGAPALVPLNHTGDVLAGDEYRVPVTLLGATAVAGISDVSIAGSGWARMAPAVGRDAVVAMLSIPVLHDRPLIVLDESAKTLADLSPTSRPCITLDQIREGARSVVPDRDPAHRAPEPIGSPLEVARDLAFCVYWAIGHDLTPARRRKALAAAGWPESVIAWIRDPEKRG